eukprot:scaffold297464_cov27-Prasinocladus_malaysianus.AAC.1
MSSTSCPGTATICSGCGGYQVPGTLAYRNTLGRSKNRRRKYDFAYGSDILFASWHAWKFDDRPDICFGVSYYS